MKTRKKTKKEILNEAIEKLITYVTCDCKYDGISYVGYQVEKQKGKQEISIDFISDENKFSNSKVMFTELLNFRMIRSKRPFWDGPSVETKDVIMIRYKFKTNWFQSFEIDVNISLDQHREEQIKALLGL